MSLFKKRLTSVFLATLLVLVANFQQENDSSLSCFRGHGVKSVEAGIVVGKAKAVLNELVDSNGLEKFKKIIEYGRDTPCISESSGIRSLKQQTPTSIQELIAPKHGVCESGKVYVSPLRKEQIHTQYQVAWQRPISEYTLLATHNSFSHETGMKGVMVFQKVFTGLMQRYTFGHLLGNLVKTREDLCKFEEEGMGRFRIKARCQFDAAVVSDYIAPFVLNVLSQTSIEFDSDFDSILDGEKEEEGPFRVVKRLILASSESENESLGANNFVILRILKSGKEGDLGKNIETDNSTSNQLSMDLVANFVMAYNQQIFSIYDQLRFGVRGITLMPFYNYLKNDVYLCHCGTFDPSFCLEAGFQTMKNAIGEIHRFLMEEEDAFVIVFMKIHGDLQYPRTQFHRLEDDIHHFFANEQIFKFDNIGELMINPITYGELIRKGKRILFLYDHATEIFSPSGMFNPRWPGNTAKVINICDNECANFAPFSWKLLGGQGMVFGHLEGPWKHGIVDSEYAKCAASCGVGVIQFDHASPKLVSGAFFSWDDLYDNAYDDSVAPYIEAIQYLNRQYRERMRRELGMLASDKISDRAQPLVRGKAVCPALDTGRGRWTFQGCQEKYRALCGSHASDPFSLLLTDNEVSFEDAVEECRKTNKGEFQVPTSAFAQHRLLNEYESICSKGGISLRALRCSNRIWINYI
eukprot:Nk52_evm38s1569 gene=Nk52_evmTU38s1569